MSDQKIPKKTHKQVSLFLKSIQQINLNSKEDSTIDEKFIENLNQQLKRYHISLVISLHNSEILLPLLEMIIKRVKTGRNEKYEKLLQFIYNLAFKQFLVRNEEYLKILKEFKNKFQVEEKNKQFQEISEVALFRYYELTQLIYTFFQIKESKLQSIPQLKQLQYFIHEQLKLLSPLNAYQECFLGWLKGNVESLQIKVYDRLRIGTNSLCCRCLFLSNQIIQYVETVNTKFIRQKSGKFQFTERRQFLKKVVISYLNGFGGSIYFGIDQNLKKARINGASVSKEQRLAFLKSLVEQIIFKIYPYQDEVEQNENQDMKKYLQTKLQSFQMQWQASKYNQYILTDYISVEFNTIHQNKTLMFSRNQKDEILYIVRINIRPGNEYRLYHFINQKDSPQTCVIQGKKQKTYYFKDYYQQMYRRLKAEASNKRYDKGESPVHLYCRSFRNMKQKTQKQ